MDTTPRMPFGRHKGQPLSQLPHDYLTWLSGLDTLREPLQTHVMEEVSRREVLAHVDLTTVKGAAKEIVSLGDRTLAQRWHPDHAGGDHKKMQTINAAKEYLERRI